MNTCDYSLWYAKIISFSFLIIEILNMSYPTRTIKNFLKIGPKEYLRQLLYIGDTKFGDLVGTDKYGNKYYENKGEYFGTSLIYYFNKVLC